MAKVRPSAVAPEPTAAAATATATTTSSTSSRAAGEDQAAAVLTVWRKSLLFNCDGFTVFDASGDLAFRADCYDSGPRRRAEVVLMDAAGTPLLTVRRKRLSLAERWVIYDGDGSGAASRPLLSVRRHVSLGGASKALAHVTPLAAAGEWCAPYVVEGSYGRRGRACAVRDARGDAVAEVRRKEDVGDDVFRLVAGPRLGAPLAMGLVVALDEMFAAGRRSARSLFGLRRTWSA